MFIQQQQLQPQKHQEELVFLRDLIPLLQDEPLRLCMLRYDYLFANSGAKVVMDE